MPLPPFKARDLRIVDNNTRDYMGGYSVETRDGSVWAGPFAAKPNAVQAKEDLVAGRQVTEEGDFHSNIPS